MAAANTHVDAMPQDRKALTRPRSKPEEERPLPLDTLAPPMIARLKSIEDEPPAIPTMSDEPPSKERRLNTRTSKDSTVPSESWASGKKKLSRTGKLPPFASSGRSHRKLLSAAGKPSKDGTIQAPMFLPNNVISEERVQHVPAWGKVAGVPDNLVHDLYVQTEQAYRMREDAMHADWYSYQEKVLEVAALYSLPEPWGVMGSGWQSLPAQAPLPTPLTPPMSPCPNSPLAVPVSPINAGAPAMSSAAMIFHPQMMLPNACGAYRSATGYDDYSAAPALAMPLLPAFPMPLSGLNAIERSMDKNGSRELQQQLKCMPMSQVQALLTELQPELRSLTTHIFGNYLVSELLNLPIAWPYIFDALKGQTASLMIHPQGCRVVQKAFEHLPRNMLEELVLELKGSVEAIATDKEGKYSIIIALKQTHAPFIINEIATAVRDSGQQPPRKGKMLIKSQNGSLFLQRLLDPDHRLLYPPTASSANATHGAPEPEALRHSCDVSPILDALVSLSPKDLEHLAIDQYANFVVTLGLLMRRDDLVNALLPSLAHLSTTERGSHVAKHAVSVATKEQLALAQANLHASPVDLKNHPFGSYVILALDRAVLARGM